MERPQHAEEHEDLRAPYEQTLAEKLKEDRPVAQGLSVPDSWPDPHPPPAPFFRLPFSIPKAHHVLPFPGFGYKSHSSGYKLL